MNVLYRLKTNAVNPNQHIIHSEAIHELTPKYVNILSQISFVLELVSITAKSELHLVSKQLSK